MPFVTRFPFTPGFPVSYIDATISKEQVHKFREHMGMGKNIATDTSGSSSFCGRESDGLINFWNAAECVKYCPWKRQRKTRNTRDAVNGIALRGNFFALFC